MSDDKKVIPEGTYSARIESYGLVRSTYSGELELQIRFAFLDGAAAGLVHTFYGDLTGNRVFKTQELLEALGYEGDDPTTAVLDTTRPIVLKVVYKPKKTGGGVYTNLYVQGVRRGLDATADERTKIVAKYRALKGMPVATDATVVAEPVDPGTDNPFEASF